MDGDTDLQRHQRTKPRPQYGSRQMATSLDGYNSHCSFTDRQKAPTALWDIWREGGGDGETQQQHADEHGTEGRTVNLQMSENTQTLYWTRVFLNLYSSTKDHFIH